MKLLAFISLFFIYLNHQQTSLTFYFGQECDVQMLKKLMLRVL